DEYVPDVIPTSSTSTKLRMVVPPSSSSAVSVNSTVSVVFSERSIVWLTLKLTIRSNDSPGNRPTFSLIRSKTTIVSCTEKPTTVSTPVTNSASTSIPSSLPRIAQTPSTTSTSWSSAITAHAPYRQGLGTCRNAHER